jgi:hypothetical protein
VGHNRDGEVGIKGEMGGFSQGRERDTNGLALHATNSHEKEKNSTQSTNHRIRYDMNVFHEVAHTTYSGDENWGMVGEVTSFRCKINLKGKFLIM